VVHSIMPYDISFVRATNSGLLWYEDACIASASNSQGIATQNNNGGSKSSFVSYPRCHKMINDGNLLSLNQIT
jgi:hypothetical protein